MPISVRPLHPPLFVGEVQGVDMRIPPDASMMAEHATQREFVYTHRWPAGDVIMWDNRCTMHRACAYDAGQVRELRRTTAMEETSTLVRA